MLDIILKLWANADCPDRLQKLCHRVILPMFLKRKPKRSASNPMVSPFVDIGAFLHKQLHHVYMTSTNTFMQWHPSVLVLSLDEVPLFLKEQA